jgi:hypothetical protein
MLPDSGNNRQIPKLERFLQGEVLCTRNVEIEWNEETVRAGVADGPKAETAKILRMDCGPMEAGVWTLK